MNKFIAFTALSLSAATAGTAFAQEQGRVLSATPVMQQVAIPQQVCNNEMVYAQRQPSGAGAILGAVVGGLAGSAIGGGSGRAAATALGVFGGSIIGNNVEAGPPGYVPMQRCGTQTYYENRTVAYDVTYEYAGRRYTTRTQYDPGPWIPLSVQPLSQGGPDAYGTYGGYGQDPSYSYQRPTQPQGYYDDGRYYGDRGQTYGNDDGRYYDNGSYQDNRYGNGDYYQSGGAQPRPGVVVTGDTGTYTAPVTNGSIEYRNSRGEPYRP